MSRWPTSNAELPVTPRDEAVMAALGQDSVRVVDQVVDGRTRVTSVVVETGAPRSEWVRLAEAAVAAVSPTVPEGTESIDVHLKSGPGDDADRWTAKAAPGGPLVHRTSP